MSWLPKMLSTVEVMETTLPAASTATKCVVPCSRTGGASARGFAPGGVPGS